MHVIAGKAVAFKEALEPGFKAYQQQVVKNARAMANTLIARGYKIVSGGTQNHLMLVDMIGKDVSGKDAEAALGKAHITVNKNSVPNDPRSPFVTSGLRTGTPAVTTRGYVEQDCVDWPTGSPTCWTRRTMMPSSPACATRSARSAASTRSTADRRRGRIPSRREGL